ncbi:MAG: hypothetical protein DCF16_18385 [Alphaproteobacteria bacterium]|nr:MAG: hypothetical protein DCF16_18385 [Alphaproteobacteria bacterium]
MAISVTLARSRATITEYVTLFDISTVEFGLTWPLLVIGTGATAIAVLVAAQSSSLRDKLGAYGTAATIAAFVIFAQTSLWLQHQDMSERFRRGEYLVVEGCVSDFDLGSAAGNVNQTFVVDGRRFEVDDSAITPAFNRSVRSGGPHLAGKFLRVAYLRDGRIIWLGEARQDACPAQGP